MFDVHARDALDLVASVPVVPAWDVALAGDHLLVAGRDAGLVVVDVGTPTAPRVVGRLPTDWTAVSVGSSGAKGFVLGAVRFTEPDARFTGVRLRAVDLSTPSVPASMGVYESAEMLPKGLDVEGEIDVPDTPVLLGSYDRRGGLAESAVRSGQAVAVGFDERLEILDVSDPHAPWRIYEGPKDEVSAAGILADGALCVTGRNGFRTLRVSGIPERPPTVPPTDTPTVTATVVPTETPTAPPPTPTPGDAPAVLFLPSLVLRAGA